MKLTINITNSSLVSLTCILQNEIVRFGQKIRLCTNENELKHLTSVQNDYKAICKQIYELTKN